MRKLFLLGVVTVSLFAWGTQKELEYSEGKGSFDNIIYNNNDASWYNSVRGAYTLNPELTDKFVAKRNERFKYQHKYEELEFDIKKKPQYYKTKENLAKLKKMAKELERLKREEAVLKKQVDELQKKYNKQHIESIGRQK